MMAWRRLGDKPLSEPMVVKLPMHICVTRPQWINTWKPQKWLRSCKQHLQINFIEKKIVFWFNFHWGSFLRVKLAINLHLLRYWLGGEQVASQYWNQWRRPTSLAQICVTRPKWVNSLWPNDAIWWHRSRSTLVQVMAWCRQATSHYLNQCWLIFSKVQWHSVDSNLTRDSPPFNH